MQATHTTIVDIIYKRLSGEALTVSEAQLLLDWEQESEYHQQLLQQFSDEATLERFTKEALSMDVLWDRFTGIDAGPPVHRLHFLKTAWFRYAAVLLLIAGTATFLYLNNRPQQDIVHNQLVQQSDIQPGGNKAVLTLSDGSNIVLDSAAIGALVHQGSTKILKLNNGSLAYNSGTPAPITRTGEVLYNTISTPKGGQYQVILPDGSKVWLNAASSIRFPTAFTNERKVTVSGEVYMEVAQDKLIPFYVTARNIRVKVLGTSFNINAYTNEESTSTTLIKGKVQVSQGDHTEMLNPGQQASASPSKGIQVIYNTDTEKVLAWKNGLFNFNHSDLPEVMRQIERWYDIEVRYETGIPKLTFGGKMSKGLKLSELLEGLERTGVHFRMEGNRTLVVLP